MIDDKVYESTAIRVDAIRQRFFEHPTVPGAYLYTTEPLRSKRLSLKEYANLHSNRLEQINFGSDSPAEYYWKNLTSLNVTYGADISHNFCANSEFDAGHLPGILRLDSPEDALPGVTQSYAYCGEFWSTFAMHVEDFNLHSLNLVIDGASKMWYGIPPHHHQLVQNLANRLYASEVPCGLPLIHKIVVLSPEILNNQIPFCQVYIIS